MPPTAPERSTDRTPPVARLGVAATILLTAWGVFAFGAVYAWAYLPLAAAAAILGIVLWKHSTNRVQELPRPILWGLAGIAGAATLQLIPLPAAVRSLLSPSTDSLLRTIDLSFAASAAAGSPLVHALSIDPQLRGGDCSFSHRSRCSSPAWSPSSAGTVCARSSPLS